LRGVAPYWDLLPTRIPFFFFFPRWLRFLPNPPTSLEWGRFSEEGSWPFLFFPLVFPFEKELPHARGANSPPHGSFDIGRGRMTFFYYRPPWPVFCFPSFDRPPAKEMALVAVPSSPPPGELFNFCADSVSNVGSGSPFFSTASPVCFFFLFREKGGSFSHSSTLAGFSQSPLPFVPFLGRLFPKALAYSRRILGLPPHPPRQLFRRTTLALPFFLRIESLSRHPDGVLFFYKAVNRYGSRPCFYSPRATFRPRMNRSP